MSLSHLLSSSKQQSPHLHEELPYRFFDEEKGMYINTSSIGFVLDIEPLSGANDDIVESLNKILCQLPEGAHWDYQITLSSNNRVGDTIEANRTASSVLGGIHAIFAENQAIYANYGAKHGFDHRLGSNTKLDLRRYDCRFCVSTTKANEEALLDTKETLTIALSTLGLGVKTALPNSLIASVRDTLNFSHTASTPTSGDYNEFDPINTQVLSPDSEFLVRDSDIQYQFTNEQGKQEQGAIVTFGLQRLPINFALAMLPNCGADITQASRSITCPYQMTVNFRLNDTGSERIGNEKKIRSLDKWLNSPMAKFMPNIGVELNDRRLLQQGLESEECKLARATVTITLFSTEKTRKRDSAAAVDAFSNASVRISPNTMIQGASFMSTLPFMGSDGYFDDCARLGLVRTIKTSNLVNFIPLVTDPYKLSYGVLLPTFRRSMYYFDPFTAGGDNFNMAVMAASGSGKSFFVQALVKNTIERGGTAFIMDKGDSYKKLTQLYGGTYLNHKDIYLNPFTHLEGIAKGDTFIDDNGEEINPLKQVIGDIVALFCTIVSPNTPLNDFQKSAVMGAIKRAWGSKGKDTLVDDVQTCLKDIAIEQDNDRRILDLAFQLEEYTTRGLFGEVFNKPSKLDPSVKLTTLELDGFKGDLLRPVVFALIVNINQAMYLSGDRTTPKMCIIEEAWKLMSGEDKAAADFIEEGYRTARKFRGSFCAVTQGVDDFFRSKGAKAAYNNADIHILLRQGDGFDQFVAQNPTVFNPKELQLLKSFPTAKNAGFSCLMLKINGQSSFHRLCADPYSRALLSTEAEEFEYLSKLQQKGMGIEEAVIQTAHHFYANDIVQFETIKAKVLEERRG